MTIRAGTWERLAGLCLGFVAVGCGSPDAAMDLRSTVNDFAVSNSDLRSSNLSDASVRIDLATPTNDLRMGGADLSGAADLARPPTDLGAVRIVGAGGYATITQGVQAARSGETVLVHAGTYREQVTIDKAITVAPFGDGDVWVDAQCTRAHGFAITGDAAVVRGLKVKQTVEAAVMISNGASSVTIDGMTLQDFDCRFIQGSNPSNWGQHHAGVAAWYAGSSLRITNNVITHTVQIARPMKGSADGIWFKSNNANPSGGGHTISGNTITGGWDGIGGEEEGSAHGTFDTNTLVENNTVSTCWDDGIQVEGGDNNVRVRNNRIEKCGTGIAFAAPVTGPLYIESNVITNLETGLYDNLFCFKVGHPGGGLTYLTNNDCLPGGLANGISQTNSSLAPIVSRGNKFLVGRYVFEMTESPRPTGESFDGDCLYTTDSSKFIKWAGGQTYTTLAAFQTATNQERTGRQTNDCSFLGR